MSRSSPRVGTNHGGDGLRPVRFAEVKSPLIEPRGPRVPLAVWLVLAGLPWLVGVARMRHLAGLALERAHVVALGSREPAVARWTHDALSAQWLGACWTWGLAGALAVGFGGVALSRRWAQRKSATDDSLRPSAGALMTAAAAAGFLSLVAGTAALDARESLSALHSLLRLDAGTRAMVFAEAAESFVSGALLVKTATGVLLVGALGLAGWVASRPRAAAREVVGGTALIVAALLLANADRAAGFSTQREVAASLPTPWQDVEGFVPMALGDADPSPAGPPVAVVTMDSIVPLDGFAVPTTSLDAPASRSSLAEALSTAQGRVPAQWNSVVRLEAMLRSQPRSVEDADGRPSMTLLVDARVPASVLRALFAAAADAGARSVVLLGADSRVTRETTTALEGGAPLLGLLVRRPRSLTVLLERGIAGHYAEGDDNLWHATVGGRAEGQLSARPGMTLAPLPVPSTRESRARPKRAPATERLSVAYLALADDATAASLATFALTATEQGLAPLVALRALPGEPDRPFDAGPPWEPSSIWQPRDFGGFTETFRSPECGPREGGPRRGDRRARPGPVAGVSGSAVEVRGSLSPQVIQRVVTRHFPEVRYCYEQLLDEHPQLAGTVAVQFMLDASGAPQSVALGRSDLRCRPLEVCIVQAVKRWSFPSPPLAALQLVTYRFVLESRR